MINIDTIFLGCDSQLANEVIQIIADYFTKQEKIYFSEKTIKSLDLFDEEDTNDGIKEDIFVYEIKKLYALKIIDLTNKEPEYKHKILEAYKNSNGKNILFICVFNCEYLLREQDELFLKKIYTLFEEVSLNNLFFIITKELNDDEDLKPCTEYFKGKLEFLFKNNQNLFDNYKYQKRVFFINLKETFEIIQRREDSLLEELKEPSFFNFITELQSSWKQIRQKEKREEETNQ